MEVLRLGNESNIIKNMITKNSVLILGAGASQPFGYPVGSTLYKNIFNTDYNNEFISAYITARNDHISIGALKNFIAKFKDQLKGADGTSIDYFLEQRKEIPDFMSIGKAFIAYHLIKCENENNIVGLDENWYSYLLNTCMNTSFENYKNNRISFLTFNYDRSLEFYLHKTLTNKFLKPENEVIELINSFPIIHLYGNIGLLPWQSKGGFQYTTSKDNLRERLKYAIDNIKILYEERKTTFSDAQALIVKADIIYFLGYGYLKENLERLNIKIMKGKSVVGSAHGIEDSERSAINKFLSDHQVEIIWDKGGLKALQFLKKYFTRDL